MPILVRVGHNAARIGTAKTFHVLRMADREIDMWRQMKVAANINGGYGGVFSAYARLHGRQQTLNPNTLLSG